MGNIIDLSDECYEEYLVRVEGKALVMPSGTRLPPICVRTNQPVTEHDMVRRDFYYCSPWYALFIFLGVILYVVVYVLARQRCTLIYGVHPDVRKMYRKRTVIKSVLAVVLCIAMFAVAPLKGPWLPILLIAFVATLISFAFGGTPLRVTKWRAGEFWVKGCSPEYLAVVSKYMG